MRDDYDYNDCPVSDVPQGPCSYEGCPNESTRWVGVCREHLDREMRLYRKHGTCAGRSNVYRGVDYR